MLCSTLLKSGVGRLTAIEGQLKERLIARNVTALDQIRGTASHRKTDAPSAFERAQYIRTLESWSADDHSELF